MSEHATPRFARKMNLPDWLSYLESLHPNTIALGLDRVAQVRQRLDLNPDFPIITVGGTNGKGSVCAMLESVLHAAGYRVGCYTSPHLLHYNERVRIEKKQASDAALCASFEKIEQARKGHSANEDTPILTEPTPILTFPLKGKERSPLPFQGGGWEGDGLIHLPLKGRGQSSEPIDIPLTYFEFGTLAAMQCFIEHKVDVAILEVGLGGRLDAVNVFDSDCAVVASVDIDHTDYLGDTREQIAFEKAGIFRAGKVAICADSDVPQALRDHAQQIGAELWCIGNEFGFASHQGQWDFYSKLGKRSGLPYPSLRGAFQLHNASAALAALDALKDRLPVSMEAVRRGLVEVQLAGRFQFVPGKPQLILDVAHNPHAAHSLAQNLAGLPPCPHTWAVFAMLKDKDIASVVAALDPYIDTWLVAGITAPRGATADELVQLLQQAGVRGGVQSFSSIPDALHHAYNVAGENDRIAAFGSFYTVAEVMAEKGLKF